MKRLILLSFLFVTFSIIDLHAQAKQKSLTVTPLEQLYNHIGSSQKAKLMKKPLIGISLVSKVIEPLKPSPTKS